MDLTYQNEESLQPVLVHVFHPGGVGPLNDPSPAKLVLIVAPVWHDPFLTSK